MGRKRLSSPCPARVPPAPRDVSEHTEGGDLQHMGVLSFPSGDHLSSVQSKDAPQGAKKREITKEKKTLEKSAIRVVNYKFVHF